MERDEFEPYASLNNLDRGLIPVPDEIDSNRGLGIAQELCEFYRSCREHAPLLPKSYRSEGEWEQYNRRLVPFLTAVVNCDYTAVLEHLKNFWRNELGPIVKQYAGFDQLGHDQSARARFTNWMARDFVLWSNLFHQPVEMLRIPSTGNPWGLLIEEELIAPKAIRFHTLTWQAQELLSDIKTPVVAEIGAGYGGFAYFLARDLPQATYVDFDLPETALLAGYYLKASLPDRRIVLCSESERFTAELLNEADMVVAPNYLLPQLPDDTVDLFVNTFSLSEMPRTTIEEYLLQISRSVRGYLLLNSMDRRGVINRGFERVPCSEFPVPADRFKRLYLRYDPYQSRSSGRNGDYRELLYRRI